jgi:hypothetical protein
MTPLLLSALLALGSDAEPWTWQPDPLLTAPVPLPAPLLAQPSAPAPAPAPTEPGPGPPAAGPAAEPAPAPPAEPTWYDEGHALVSEGLRWSVERLDQFFGDERPVDLPRSRSYVRWRNDLVLRDDGTAGFTTGLRAELRIPSLDRRLERLRITIAGGTTDALDRLLPGDTPSPDAVNQPSAGLKLFLLDTLLTQTDLQAGFLFSLPVGWYTRLRLRHVRPVEDLLVARFALSTFWQTPTGWGTRQDADLERQLAPWLLLRLANTGTITERSRGWEWSSELALLAAVGQRTALFLGGAALGATDVGPVVEVWKVHARARRDVLRRWLFLELEPGVEWKRPPGGGRLRERSLILRLDVQFDAARAGRSGPGPAPAAPRGPAPSGG